MRKEFLLSFAAAACLLTASPQIGPDGAGVTVSTNGATLMHRPGISYPVGALHRNVEGVVRVEVKLDSTGVVNDAKVLSGPDELRRSALESVLQWHFSPDVGGTTRVVQIGFEMAKLNDSASATAVAGTSAFRTSIDNPAAGAARVGSIHVNGFSDTLSAQLLATLPIHEGDEWNAASQQKVQQALTAFDEHLTLQVGRMKLGDNSTDIRLQIVAPNVQAAVSAPNRAAGNRMQVPGAVQGAMIVSKTPPVYPELAKQARVSGVVKLAAVIARDGTVQELHSLGGPALLVQAAMDAVRQWVYRPTLMNGAPVEVETTIDINFTLSQ